MEGCLTHIEGIADGFAAKYRDDRQADEMRRIMQEDLARLRTLARRLRLYGELPSLYARRFSEPEDEPARCSHELAAETARAAAAQWARDADLEILVRSGSVPLPADSLAVLVTELVDNACKFSAPATPIVLDARPEPACWRMTISDRGRGLLPAQIREIGAFKQFWNGAERPHGLGLGLVLVQAVARLHAGEVLIESDAGAGTRVTVMIPSE
jgi:signal transduction histidine kinase